MLLSLPLFWFAFLSGFSGSVLYNSWLTQTYNILFTIVPIIIFGLFDEEHTR